MTVSGIAGVVVVGAFGSPGVVVGAAKDVVTVKAKAAPMAPPLIRRAPKVQAIVQSAGRPGAAVRIAMNGRAAVAREVTTPMAPLLRHREARADLVGIVCPKMIFIENAASV